MKNIHYIVNCWRTVQLHRSSSIRQLFAGSAKCIPGSLKGIPGSFKCIPGSLNQTKSKFRQITTLIFGTSDQKKLKFVGYWLLGCCALVGATVSVGGVTRLTESGLSMVDWKFAGRRAPGTAEEWELEWEKYKESPQYRYQVIHQNMTMNQFKFIWYMEWGHRQLGRVIGMCVLLPSLALFTRKWVSKPLKIRLAGFNVLVVFQGLLGWYMVKSGLQDKPESRDIPRVSQYRLASHLAAAFVLYLAMFKTSLELVLPPAASGSTAIKIIRVWAGGVAVLSFLTAISGAFVAGLDAGLVYNSYPKFADQWVPEDIMALSPKWKNYFENTTTVQFNHRLLAHCLILTISGLWLISQPIVLPKRGRTVMNSLATVGWVQVGLGISTLLLHVPTWLAACHQQGSLVLLTLAFLLHHELRPALRRIK